MIVGIYRRGFFLLSIISYGASPYFMGISMHIKSHNIGRDSIDGVIVMNEGLVVFVRSLIAFFSLLIFARMIGKQQISQLTFFDYVLGITIGSIAASLSVDLSSRAWPHWIGLLTWTVTVLALQLITLKSKRAANYLLGEPSVVIMDGQIMEEALRRIRYTVSDILEQLRDKDVFDLKQVAFGVVETNGKLSVLLKPEYLPLTPKDMNLPTQSNGLGTELIYDGIVIEENLDKSKVDRYWLQNELTKNGIKVSDVFLAYLDGAGGLYLDLYKDHVGGVK